MNVSDKRYASMCRVDQYFATLKMNIYVYITNYLHFSTMFLSLYHRETLKTITLVKTF